MKKNLTKKIFQGLSFLFFIVPLPVFAADSYLYQFHFIPESAEVIFDIFTVAFSLVAAFYSVKLAALNQGGSLEKVWNRLAVITSFFALLQLMNGLEEGGVIFFSGLTEPLELLIAILFLVTFYQGRKQILKQVLGK